MPYSPVWKKKPARPFPPSSSAPRSNANSVRSRAALATLGITKVGELVETSETTLLSCKNFGQTSLDEIRTKLRHLNLELGG